MFISSCCDTSIRSASLRTASDAVRCGTSATISTACAWWPIMPCMNLMSAPVYWTCDRLLASAAAITRLGSPGAPGWTIGGREAAGVAGRDAVAAAALNNRAAIGYLTVSGLAIGYTPIATQNRRVVAAAGALMQIAP